MKIKKIFSAIFVLMAFSTFAQKVEYSILLIPDSLKQNANALVRSDITDIAISSQRKMTITNKKVTTVFNEKGFEAITPVEHYDKKTTIRKVEATILDAMGNEIKKIKRKDFLDQSAADGFSIFSDNRMVFLSYTPTQYPFTLVYECEKETSNTAFIPEWYPMEGYFVSVQRAMLNVYYPDNLGFKKKELNFSGFRINKTTDTPTQLSYSAENLPALKKEDFSPPFHRLFPKVMLGLEHFNLEGVDGTATTWKEFGQWYSDKILAGTAELPQETINKIKALVGDEKDPVKKAKIVYNFVQQKSRYVSIQVGIGGWKPMLANDVDRLGYGDCKALSNYTRALLQAVDVPSYNTLLYGSRSKRDFQSDFVSMQGNHMILSVPDGDNYIWLECTSQTDPFGYQGTFTDDRDVLVLKPEGGEIVRTKLYDDMGNRQISNGQYALSENGDLDGSISIVSEGTQYNQKFSLADMPQVDKDKHYKEYWSNINNLKISKSTFSNDREKVRFTEDVAINAGNYANLSGTRMMFAVNAYNRNSPDIRKIRNRRSAFEIQRGFYDSDEIAIDLPKGFSVEAMPNPFELKSKFGAYKTEVLQSGEKLVYKRSLLIKKGSYSNKDYEDYRLFWEQVSRNDNSKIILIKS